MSQFQSVDALQTALVSLDYLAHDGLAVALYLALARKRPLFLEGEAGVGKTQIAKTLAAMLNKPLIRLQCYEGLDINAAAYEWNYARQMVDIQAGKITDKGNTLFTETYLIARPLLQAIRPLSGIAPVLLIDELDRTDEAFEAYLLELLSDWQITIPELGQMTAEEPPVVIITSNRTREVHDALKRRCFYHWVDYPDFQQELDILNRKAPDAGADLKSQLVSFVQKLRQQNLFKAPGVAETIDWAQALVELNCVALDPQMVDSTMGVLLKYQDDIARVRSSEVSEILKRIEAEHRDSDRSVK